MECDEILLCPNCSTPNLVRHPEKYFCSLCEAEYLASDGITSFLRPDTAIKNKDFLRAEFWNAGWEHRSSNLLDLNKDDVIALRNDYYSTMCSEGYPSVTQLSEANVNNKLFLNIGCGGGYEGLLFSGYGANYVGVDFSFNAVNYTSKLVARAGYTGEAYQAEAEALPFKANVFDFVYTNGVLHHTPNTEATIIELRRVLKPGGTAMIGLYATFSIMFIWYRLHAIANGNFSTDSVKQWLDTNTEGEWQTEDLKNKLTKTYTKKEFSNLLKGAGFENFTIIKTPKQLKDIPVLGVLSKIILPASVREISLKGCGGMLMAICSK
jgi:ubiquinone/menaquinone biosynthesis C-methylase UbiE